MGDNDSVITFRLRENYSINIRLTPEQSIEYKRIIDEIPESEYQSVLHYGFGFFIAPEQVSSHHCGECNEDIEGSPIVRIKINSPAKDSIIRYICGGCNHPLANYNVYESELEKIPEELIEFDATGDYIRPTPKSIDGLFTKIEAQAETGIGHRLFNGPSYEKNLEMMVRWAKKIELDLDKSRIGKLEGTYKTSYLRNFQESLPERVRKILKAGMNDDYMDNFNISYNGFEMSPYEDSGLSDMMPPFLEALPHLERVGDRGLNMNILRILDLYKEMHDREVSRLAHEKEEIMTKKIKEMDEQIQSFSSGSGEANQMRTQFIDQSGLTDEDIKAGEDINPLDYFDEELFNEEEKLPF